MPTCASASAPAGHEIWFQPQSQVVHYEGKTAGTDTGAGVKAYQVVNTRKFLCAGTTIAGDHRLNGEAPYFERERCVHRRALVVDATTPTPNQDAGSVTTVLTLRLFQQLGYKTYFMPQDNFLFQPRTPPTCSARASSAPMRRTKAGSTATSAATARCSMWCWCIA